ncbi:hypothetical protein GH714_034993 [Hevea brasiliensis]|uniref:cytokinin dehydrogenase n=1 Tax=Hevea brasiliensis TaxID=3981 RepID=A0A6A6KMM4_HEVBR|nr:hypothetical protein GH714_034993 [Hevea brasiliensis]
MGSPPSSFIKQKAIIFLGFFMVLFLCSIADKSELCSNSSFLNSSVPSYKNFSNIPWLETLNLDGYFSFDDIEHAAKDFGNRYHFQPSAVLYPKSVADISSTIKYIFDMGSTSEITVAARGHGHSVQGQAQAHRGGELWINVLHETGKYGLAPKSWTDYLHLTVGGTLSNAGISGQAFRHGPQINNVYQLEVITGKGEAITCSEQQNADLFYGVLGGLGQFGIITRAVISLERAPKMGIVLRVPKLSNDQEYLISSENSVDYIEGFVIINRTGLLNNWRTSFSPKDPLQASQFISDGRTLYCLEIAKYFNPDESDIMNQKTEELLSELSYIPSTLLMSEVSYVEFLDRVHVSETKLRIKGLWEVPHPWMNLLIPRSKISEFAQEVFGNIRSEGSNGPVLIYPVNKSKWNNRTSLITPAEDIFYIVAFLSSAAPSSTGKDGLQQILTQNQKILDLCSKANLGVKQYLPHYGKQEEWQAHFGTQWEVFAQRKSTYDPYAILAPGQRIFRRK